MLYQTFRKFPDGTVAKFGRTTPNLRRAVERAAAVKGEVRPLGSLTPCWRAHVFVATPMPLRPAPEPVRPVPRVPAPRFTSGSSEQRSVVRYYPAGK